MPPALAPPSPAPATNTAQKSLRSERHRAPLLWLLIPFAAGITAEKMLPVAPPVAALLASASAFVLASLLIIFLSRRHALALAALVVALFLAGASNYEIRRARLAEWETLPAREANLTLRITSLIQQNTANLGANAAANNIPVRPRPPRFAGLARVTEADPHLANLVGQPLFFSLTLPRDQNASSSSSISPAQIIRTAEIKTTGVLDPLPRNSDLDSFEGHLVASGMNFTLTRGTIDAIARPPTATANFYERMRLRFSDILGIGLQNRPREAGIYRAMTLGQKQEIDIEQTAIFLGSGTMHLFAISGIHIVVIATGLQFLLLLLRLPRWTRFLVGTAALWIYVQITGASPSAVRAFWMVAILQTSFVFRVPANGIAALALAALVTLIVAPMQLFSASFQMSYGIVAAILLYGLPLGETWNTRWVLFRDIPKIAWTLPQRALSIAHRYFLGVLAISISASLVSMICGAIYFKLIAPGSLFANLLLIPAASLVILAGFLSIICGLLGLTPLSVLFNHAAALVLYAMQKLLKVVVEIPGMSYPAHFAPAWLGTTLLAAILAAMLYGYSQKWRLRRGGFWPPVAIVLIVLFALLQYD